MMRGVGLCFLLIFGLARDVETKSDVDLALNGFLGSKTSNDMFFIVCMCTMWVGPEGAASCSGWVSPDAEILKALPWYCFKAYRNSTGVYTVTFNPVMRSLPICVVSQIYPGNFDGHGNSKDNVVIMNADRFKLAYVAGDQNGNPSNRNATFICLA
jgi:hypothetical protein